MLLLYRSRRWLETEFDSCLCLGRVSRAGLHIFSFVRAVKAFKMKGRPPSINHNECTTDLYLGLDSNNPSINLMREVELKKTAGLKDCNLKRSTKRSDLRVPIPWDIQ
jgi:hypothetical protein